MTVENILEVCVFDVRVVTDDDGNTEEGVIIIGI